MAQPTSFEAIEQELFISLTVAKTAKDSIDIYNELAYNYRRTAPQKILTYAEIALRMAQTASYDRGFAYAYRNKGIAYYKSKASIDSTLLFHQTGLAYAEKAEDYYCQASCNNNLGLLQFEDMKFNKAIEYFLSGLILLNEHQIEANRLKALLTGNTGSAYFEQGDFLKAEQYYEAAIAIGRKYNEQSIISIYLDELALTAMHLGKEALAEQYIQEVLPIHQALGDHQSLFETEIRYAEIKLQQAQAEEALIYAQKAYEDVQTYDINFQQSRAERTLAKVYLALNEFEEAEKYALTALEKTETDALSNDKYESLNILADIFAAQNNYEKAYKYIKEASVIDALVSDKVQAQRTEEKLSEFNIKTKEQEILRLEQSEREKNTRIQYLTFLLVLGSILSFILINLYRRKNKLAGDLEQKNKEITQQREDLDQLNRLKDQLFSTISHDLKSPIASLESSLDYLLSEQISKKEFLSFSKQIKENASHLRATIDELMKWSYMQIIGLQPRPERVNVQEVAEESIQFYLLRAKEKGIVVENHIPSNLSVAVDKEHMCSILRNLLSNAIKFSFQDSKIELCGWQNCDCGTVCVKDKGIGVSKEKQEEIFKVGVSGWGTVGEKGTGLGLALCKEFAEQNNGKIWVESEIGTGSTFCVSFPMQAEERSLVNDYASYDS